MKLIAIDRDDGGTSLMQILDDTAPETLVEQWEEANKLNPEPSRRWTALSWREINAEEYEAIRASRA